MSTAPRISIGAEFMEEPPSYDESRNRNRLPSSSESRPEMSLHAESIIEARRSTDASPAAAGPTNYEMPDIMPTLSMLPGPTELFADAAPYYLMITCHGPTARISGSHQPSLRLLAEYFKKWSRVGDLNREQKFQAPLIEVKIFGSRFSQKDYVDVAVLTTKLSQGERAVPKSLDLNPALIVGFVTGVLGYRIINIGNEVWHFQRERMFLVLD